MFKDYEHHAQYYETDQMGLCAPFNYIRWMEEARVNLMEQIGCGYRAMKHPASEPGSGGALPVQVHGAF